MYLVKFDTGPCGDTYGVLVSAPNRKRAVDTAESIAKEKNLFHYGVRGVYEVNADWR